MTHPVLDLARAGHVQVAVFSLLLLTLIARMVVQLTVRSALRRTLRILDTITVPLFVAFAVIIVQRFGDLS